MALLKARHALLLGSVLAWLLLAAPASGSRGTLVLGRSMAGVRLDDGLPRLRAVLGAPKVVKRLSNEITGTEQVNVYGRLAFYSYPAGSAGSILYMETTRRSIRTASGIGVGTRKRVLERELPSMSCVERFCSVVVGGGVATIGKRITSFRIRNGRVRVISIGRVID